MKKFIKYIRQMALGSALCVALWACSNMNELSDKFLDTGEAVYAAKVDSALTYTGYKKVGMDIYVSSSRIDTVKVYYNEYKDCVDIPVNQPGIYPTVIEDLEERNYIFQLVTIDSYGNKSLPVEVSVQAYGDNLLSLLIRSRNITSAMQGADGMLTVNWGSAVENSSGCRLTYTNTSNAPATVTVSPTETTTAIPDFKAGLRFSTQFEIGAGSIIAQTFSTDEAGQPVYKVFPKTGWLAEASSFHDAPRQASAAIDGNPRQPWHSRAGGGQVMPQWIILDFGSGNELPIDGILFQHRIDDIGDKAFPNEVKWESSNDKTTWTTILESILGPTYPTTQAENPLWLLCTTPTTARYLRGTIYNTYPTSRAYTYIGELGIYQIVE